MTTAPLTRKDVRTQQPVAGRRGGRSLSRAVRTNGLALVVVLVGIVLEFTTDGLFLSPRNLTNLAVAAAVTALLASGIVPIMVTGNIDLSPAAAVAITGLTVAWLSTTGGHGVVVSVLGALVVGLAIGLWHGLWVVIGRVPSFIVTLASLLGLGGLAIALTSGQTLPVSPGIIEVSSTVIPPAIGIVGAALLIAGTAYFASQDHAARRAGGSPTSVLGGVLLPVARITVIAAVLLAVGLSYQGLPLPVGVVVVFASVVNIWTKYTVSGRRLYAIGGNPRAATLAGIRSGRHIVAAFALQGLVYGIAGVLSASYVASASPSGQTGLELAVITAAVIGGTSLFGGVGTVFGALLGTLLTAALQNGLQLQNVDGSYVQIIIAFVLLVAVLIDIRTRSSIGR